MRRFLLDTNIVLRYVYVPASEHASVVHAVELLKKAGDALFVTPQVLREFWSVATRPSASNGFAFSIEEAERSVQILLREFALLDDGPGIFADWLELVTRHSVRGLPTHDANHAAAARHHGLTHVLTLNASDFKRYAHSGLSILTPADV